jgi:hypothetical protein
LRQAVFVRGAPCLYCGLIAEERQRQDFAGLAQALEAFDGDEAVDLLEDGAQLRGDIKIFFLALRLWPDLEDDGDQFVAPTRLLQKSPEKATIASPDLWRATAA